jgi:peptidoglycan/LPS O-acetylase OafA/YrhL
LTPKNNFDFLRIVFAIFVIITHAYPLSGSVSEDWVSQISNHQMSFSYIGVAGFFAISGYLVTQSLERSKTIKEYFLKRILRIYPALIGVLLLTLLSGAFLYSGNFSSYLKNSSVWTYVPFNLSLFNLQYSISGIFENNPFKYVINGSLCTLPYEMLLYILLSVLFYFRNNRQRILIVAFAFTSIIVLKIFFHTDITNHRYPFYFVRSMDYSGFFCIGALLALLRVEQIKYKNMLLGVVLLVWIAALLLQYYVWIQHVVLPLAVILLGNYATSIIKNIKSKIGDFSYGIYIYAFPVQQTLEHFFRLTSTQLMIFGTICTLPFAFISWHIIEKKALALKYSSPNMNLQNL